MIDRCNDIICNKCKLYIRTSNVMSKKFYTKYAKKKVFCGRCIQERINRNNPDYDYDKEFPLSTYINPYN